MFCQKCGAENQDEAVFCSACGATLVYIPEQYTPESNPPVSKRSKKIIAPTVQRKENLQIDLVSGSASAPATQPQSSGFLILIAIIFGLMIVFFIGLSLIFSFIGNTQTNDVSKFVSPAVIVVPTRTIIPGQDPIIGTWHGTAIGQIKTIFHTFTSDGHYSNTDSISDFTESGTWIKEDDNRYIVTVHYKNISFMYQPDTGTIATVDTPELRFYPSGLGPAIITPTPVPTTTVATTIATYQKSSSVSSSSSSSSSGAKSGKCYVRSYTRKDGTHVSGYYRRC